MDRNGTSLHMLHVEPQALCRIQFRSSIDSQQNLWQNYCVFPKILLSLSCVPPTFLSENMFVFETMCFGMQ